MGVDYTAFVCWGVRTTGADPGDFENHGSLLAKAEDKCGYAEYGSRNYGGDGGFVLMISETYVAIDMRREPSARPLPHSIPSNRWEAVLHGVREKLRLCGVDIKFEGGPGWLVCGLVS